jgi:hypothetical protein
MRLHQIALMLVLAGCSSPVTPGSDGCASDGNILDRLCTTPDCVKSPCEPGCIYMPTRLDGTCAAPYTATVCGDVLTTCDVCGFFTERGAGISGSFFGCINYHFNDPMCGWSACASEACADYSPAINYFGAGAVCPKNYECWEPLFDDLGVDCRDMAEPADLAVTVDQSIAD